MIQPRCLYLIGTVFPFHRECVKFICNVKVYTEKIEEEKADKRKARKNNGALLMSKSGSSG